MPADYSYLKDLTDQELADLKAETEAAIEACGIALPPLQADMEQKEAEKDQKLEDFLELEGGQVLPIVEDETSVDTGHLTAVKEVIGVDIPVAFSTSTGNGDDGIGVIQDWSVPLEISFKPNLQIYTSGEKVSRDAQLLEADGIGTIPSYGDSLLESGEGIIIPDLFDPDLNNRFPDRVYDITLGAPEAPEDNIFEVGVFAAPADRVWNVRVAADPPDQVFEVQTLNIFHVAASEPAFIVDVMAEPPDYIFNVRTSATPPNKTFNITRGPDPLQPGDTVYEVFAASLWEVTTGFAPPDTVFEVKLGPKPAEDPDEYFNVSVGGPDAPPIPEPHVIYGVRTGFATPDSVLRVKVMEELRVDVAERPFMVTTSAEPADQTWTVTTSARPFDEQFVFTVGARLPDQTLEVVAIDTFEVASYQGPISYTVQENLDNKYVITGNGLTYAVQPTLQLKVGQLLELNLNVPANALWIKTDQGEGPGLLDPGWGDITGQGSVSGKLRARIWVPGDYYYQSEFSDTTYGRLEVRGEGAPAAQQIFNVETGAAVPDTIHSVRLGAAIPFQTYSVSVLDNTPDDTFAVSVFATPPTQINAVTISEPAVGYLVTNNADTTWDFTGNGLTDEPNPQLILKVGQSLAMTLQDNSGNKMWIKDVDETGAGELNPEWAYFLTGQGSDEGVAVRFRTAGTYYYVSQGNFGQSGEIVVQEFQHVHTVLEVTVGAQPADQLFDVQVAEPIGAEFDERFMISTAELPFMVTTGAPEADQVFDVAAVEDILIVTLGPEPYTPGGLVPVTVITEFRVTAGL